MLPCLSIAPLLEITLVSLSQLLSNLTTDYFEAQLELPSFPSCVFRILLIGFEQLLHLIIEALPFC